MSYNRVLPAMPWWWRVCYWIAGVLLLLALYVRDTWQRVTRYLSGTLPGEVEAERRWRNRLNG